MRKVYALITLVCLTCIASSVYGQGAANYVYSTLSSGSLSLDKDGNTIDMTTGTTQLYGADVDTYTGSVQNFGFGFYFMGTQYQEWSANPDGQIRLGSTVISGHTQTATAGVPYLFANNTDTKTGTSGKVHYKVQGVAPNRVLIVEWKDVQIYWNVSTTIFSTWQTRLYESGSVIEYVYGRMYNNNTSAYAENIGFSSSNTAGSIGQVVTINTTPSYNTTATSYTSTTFTASADMTNLNSLSDGSRRVFRFVPPVPDAAPTGLSFSSVTSSSMTLNWTDNATNEAGYHIFRSTDGINYVLATQTTANTTSSNQTGLAPGTNYYWRIVAFAEGGITNAINGNQATLAAGNIVSNGTGGGNWSDPATWQGGVVPGATDNATVRDGDIVIVNTTGLVCNNLVVGEGASGTLQYIAGSPSGLTVFGNITVAVGGTFSAGTGSLFTHTLNVGGNTAGYLAGGSITNNGTFDMNTTAGVGLTFFGSNNASVSGTGSVNDFYAITVNKGTTQTGAMVDIVIPITMSTVSTSTNRLVLTAGTFKISSASNITPIGGTQTVCAASARLWLAHGGASYNGGSAGSPTVSGELRIDDGIFNYGVGNNTLTFTSGSGVLRMSGGTINMYGAIAFPSSTSTQMYLSGGIINVDPQVGANNLGSGTTIFSIGASTTVEWSGGTINIIDPHSVAAGTAWSASSGGTKNITGGTLIIGDGVSTSTSGTGNTGGFGLTSSMPVYNLVINNSTNASATRMARMTGSVSVLNNLTINPNAYLFLGSSTTTQTLTLQGANLVNNGTLAGDLPGATANQFLGTLSFNHATTSMNVSGAGKFQWLNTMQNSGNVSLSQTDTLVVNRVNLFSGTFTRNSQFSIGRSASGGTPVIQAGGGGATVNSGMFDATPVLNGPFAPSYLYSTMNGAPVMGSYNEMTAGDKVINTFLLNDADGLTVNRNVQVIGILTMTLGNFNFGTYNLMVGQSATVTGTVTNTSGLLNFTTGTMTRWYGTASLPTSIANSNLGHFPIGYNGNNRNVWFSFSAATALTTGGTITVGHSNTMGITAIPSFVDGGQTVDTRSNASWTISQSGLVASGTINARMQASGNLFGVGTVANLRMIRATDAVGTSSNGTNTAADPQVNRTGMSVSDIANTFYFGGPAADLVNVYTSIASGNWEDGSTWNQGSAPNSTSSVIIANGHVVSVNAVSANALTLTVNTGGTLSITGSSLNSSTTFTNNGMVNVSAGILNVTGASTTGITNTGTLTVSGGNVTVGIGGNDRRFTNTGGTLTVSNGTLNINGNLAFTSGIFNQSGGNIIVDGNAGGSAGVASGTVLVSFGSGVANTGTVSGGSLTIVDPPYTGTARSLEINFTSGTWQWSPSHTTYFGDGISTDASANTSGFQFDTYVGSSSTQSMIGSLVVNGGSVANRWATTTSSSANGSYVKGNIIVNPGSELRDVASGGNLVVSGNIVNNGTMSMTSVPVVFATFTGASQTANTVAQTVSGTGTFRNSTSSPTANFTSLTVNNTSSGGVTFGTGITSPTFSGGITVTNGNVNATGITLQGSSAQTVALTAATSLINVSDFTLNNSTGATLSGSGFLNVSGVATITSGTLASAGRLTLKSTSSGTARIAPLVGTITGNVVVERYIPANGKRAWRLLGANVTAASAPTIKAAWQEGGVASSMGTHITQLGGAGTNGFDASAIATANHSIYAWNGTALTAPANTDVNKITDNGGAYFLFVRGDRNINLNNASASSNTTLRMTGVVNQGPVAAGVAGTSFSLIPNPYPSPVDYEAIIAGNVGLTGTYYIWDANLGTVGAYRAVVRTGAGTYEQTPYAGSTVSDNTARYIRSGQAFFIPNNMQVNFTEAMKTDMLPGINVYRPGTGTEQMMIELKVIEAGGTATLYDGVRAKYNNSFSANVDINDAPKLNNFTENLAIVRSNKNLAVETRPLVDAADTIFLKLWNTGNKNYRFDINPANFSSAANLDAYLVDAYLNTTTPVSLSSNTAYDFNITSNTASAASDRFMIVFRPATTLPANFTVVKAYQKNSGIQVEWNVGSEVDVVKYEVEKSTNGITFDKTGTVSATSSKAYNWFDASPNNGANFYRIKVINKDNTFNYSNVVNVKLGNTNADIAVYPNPVKGNVINLQFNNLEKGTYTVRLINSVGQQVYSSKIVHNGGSASQVMQLNTALSKGIYQLVVSNGDTKQTMQVIAE